ncbi:ABC transporter substrate-binding protein [Bradyrhizobium sp. BEA-2-5]|uniref:ABC transporter substrate-binding protein n=1 Tax=Bradyrhizobium sp. BEA-2-5 TaxID=3080015 RepID=UPI00293EC029|nr:ABC transporter substrate-binding protein [Bradyrhizobium sp. BEA-2-5]WOH80416.1 ABC transporter substrate-binding protein [Bradyrhizobium sp. BEA-2-5]
MGKHTVHINRRSAVGLISAALAAPFVLRSASAQSALPEQTAVPDILKGSGEVRVATFGGATQDAQQKAWFEPFEKATGIKVRIFPGVAAVKTKAMVDTGNVEWDLVDTSRQGILQLMKAGDYFEKIDYSLIDDSLPKEFRFEYGVEELIWAQVMGYRTDAFKGAAPASWADFWDLDKFPGDRAMYGNANNPELEFALMAAGGPADKLYPIDIDKALASYDKIKKRVVKWWTAGAQPPQMLTDREVVMTTVSNGRMSTLIEQGAPVAINWNQGLLRRNAWGVPKGAKNKGNAMKLIAYSLMPIPQARFAMLIPYGATNPAANKHIPPQRLAMLPSAPEIQKQLVFFNEEWWVENGSAVQEKFSKWLLG